MTDEWFRHFFLFLKKNKIYIQFMDNLRNQTYPNSITKYYLGIDYVSLIRECCTNKRIPNFIKMMKTFDEYGTNYKEYGSLIFTFASFAWADYETPFPFRRKWCTVSLKWGLYSFANNIEVCDKARFIKLVTYWNAQKWIDSSMLSKDEIKMLKDEFGITNIDGRFIDELLK